MRKPDWKIGYSLDLRRRLLEEKRRSGTNQQGRLRSGRLVFVVKVGDGEELYDKTR
jgi:hypothetical protein